MDVNITATRFGWARFSAPGVDGAARFARTSTGRLDVAELVVVGAVRDLALAPLEAWANGPGLERVCAGLELRSGAVPAEVGRMDAEERAEAPRRAAWGTGGRAEAEQAEALALARDPGPDDGFYAEVARAYGAAAVAGPRPASAVAAANGVPREKVYQWVKEARRRGLMPAARRGAAA